MHTPRFSGQPFRAGDLVLEIIPSRPMRTSCENVGTVFLVFPWADCVSKFSKKFESEIALYYAQTNVQGSRSLRRQIRESTHNDSERCTANPVDQQETPHALQEAEFSSWYRTGEAYSAFRGWRPIPAALPSHSVVLVPGPKNSLPTTASPEEQSGAQQQGRNTPDKREIIEKVSRSVKSVS